MAIFASIAGLAGRFVGRFLTTTLGWASTLLFGRVPERRQVWFAVLTFGSLVWVATVAGIVVPTVGTLLLALMPLPGWVDENTVRLGMLAAALVLPAILGAVTLLIADADERSTSGGRLGAILRGYPLTPVLAGTLVLLAGVGIVRKARAVVSGRATTHVALVIRPRRYDALVAKLERVVRDAGVADRVRDGSRLLTAPARLLASISGAGIRSLVPDRLAVLEGPDFQLHVYPADLALSGRKLALARGRAAVMRELRSDDAWFTTDRAAQEIEDLLASLGDPAGPRDAAALQAIDRRLATEAIDAEQWDVLYRRRLQVTADATGTDLGEPAAEPLRRRGPGQPRDTDRPRLRPGLGTIVGTAVAVLVALDLVLAFRQPEEPA
ncbi:MAG: hypothetical protein HYX57_10940 [Chloroflexi bacterium]|nr:hypothetical protein [Chloroflexota bacterium]